MSTKKSEDSDIEHPNGEHPDGELDSNGKVPSSEAIQAAAFDLFARRGYLAASVREVMKACGLTQGALYNHFPSKNQLLATLIRTTQDGLEKRCADAVAAVGDSPAAQLRAFVEAFTERHCERRTEALVANRDFEWLKPASLDEILASRRRIRDMLVEILDRGERLGSFHLPHAKDRGNSRIVAMAILNQCIYVSNWFRPGGTWTQREVAVLHAEMALRIVAAR
jgi:AcrR family transcriptional regulator